jgi:ABC-2 type transport system permease protein
MELEYRVNFIGLLFLSLIDAVWSIGGALLFYSHRATIGGWTFNQCLIVIGLYFLAYGFVDVVMRPNIDDIVEHIRTGTMDFVLVKPINSQMHATLRRFRFQKLSSVAVGCSIIIYALIQLHQAPDIGQLLLFMCVCMGSMVLLYSAMTLLATLSFWLVDVTNIDDFIVGFLEAGRFPADAFPEPVRKIITFVIPIAFITTIPAEVLLGRLTLALVVYGWAIALLLLAASIGLWRVALQHYTSASS